MTQFARSRLAICYLVALVTLLLSFASIATAQEGTGAPPPQEGPNSNQPPTGQPVIDNATQVLPPEGVPGLDGDGVITVIPPAEDGISYIDVADEVTIYVTTNPTRSQIVRTEIEPFAAISNTFPPEDDASIIEGIEIDVYWSDNADEVRRHNPALLLSRDVPNPEITLVFLYNEADGSYTPMQTIIDVEQALVMVDIFETHPDYVFVWVEIANDARRAAYQAEAENNRQFDTSQRTLSLARLSSNNAGDATLRDGAKSAAGSDNAESAAGSGNAESAAGSVDVALSAETDTASNTSAVADAADSAAQSTALTTNQATTPTTMIPIALALVALAFVIGGVTLYLRKHE